MKECFFVIFILIFLIINGFSQQQNKWDISLKSENPVMIFQKKQDSPFPLTKLDINIGYLYEGKGFFDSFKDMAESYVNSEIDELKPKYYHLIFWLLEPDYLNNTSFENKFESIKKRFPLAKIILVTAENLPFDEFPDNLDALIYSDINTSNSWVSMAEAAFGGIEVTRNIKGESLTTPFINYACDFPKTRLKFGTPEDVGMSADTLALIDKIVNEAIKKDATPGARILVAKNGVIILDKCYGWFTYDKKRSVEKDDVYDLASVTKIVATMPVLMQLYDLGRWRLADEIVNFIPEADTTDKRSITMKQLLLHESGLQSSISFYTEAIDKTNLNEPLFSRKKTTVHTIKLDDNFFMNKMAEYRTDVFAKMQDLNFSVPIAKDYYMNYNYLDTMFNKILSSKVNPGGKYLYSDLNFLLLQRITENLYSESLDVVFENHFCYPLGANTLCFNPWRTISLEQIAPTENDVTFRYQVLQGYVHDQAAAMMGGVAGHAGLFGSAYDLAKILQMLLNKGIYGGHQYISSETIDFFTSTQSKITKRGLGFDKYDPEKSSYSSYSSPSAYGHTGFTGTMVWVDPEYDLIYIFLSNRIHPYQYNRKLSELSVRSRVMEVVYRAIY